MIQKDIRYLELLSHDFPNLAAASTEIINLEAILNLPKGTEHFSGRPARGIRSFPACAPQCFRSYQTEGKRDFRQQPPRNGRKRNSAR